ncbi:MAG: hypothetical protein L0K82_05445 [Pisciglobus halotolerans]|nr:hypothetical protein [Pisciglobus halotolerans]
MKLTILGQPITKKNSQQIYMNKRTKKPFITPSAKCKQYRRDFLIQALQFKPKQPIDSEICITALYYMPTKRRVDITNLMNATHDLLQDAKIIADDSSKIVKSVDGTRVLYDKMNPRVEIVISEYKDVKQCLKQK